MLELNRINIFFDGKSTVKLPVYVIPSPTIPNTPKKIENPKLNEKGKLKPKKKDPKGQLTLWPR